MCLSPQPLNTIDGHWFSIASIDVKLASLDHAIEAALGRREPLSDISLGRDLGIVSVTELPPKPGLNRVDGQARLLHDLANIELQATELAVRGLSEFPDAPAEFREQLATIAREEGRHLAICLQTLRELGFEWGHWDAHLMLWNAVTPQDSLLDRVLIVHRYLEGSGLDAGESLLRRLIGVGDKRVRTAVRTIVDEEVAHVGFGSYWYRQLAELEGRDVQADFVQRLARISLMAPRRERLAIELRQRAGFTDFELAALEDARLRTLHPGVENANNLPVNGPASRAPRGHV